MKKNTLVVLSLISVLSLSLSANAAIDVKSGIKAGVQASLANSNTTTANTAAINSYKSQIKSLVSKSNSVSTKFNTAVNNVSNLFMSKNEISKIKGSLPANSAEATDKLVTYLISGGNSATLSKRVSSLSADKKAQLTTQMNTIKTSVVEYTNVMKQATTLSANIAKTPSVAVALSPELKSLKQVSANASNQAKNASKLSTALLGFKK